MESRGAGETIVADVRAPTPLEPRQVAEIEEALRRHAQSAARLVVRSVLTRDASAEGYIYARGDQETLDRASAAIEREIARLPGARLAGVHGSTSADAVEITAVVEAPEAVSPPLVRELRDAVAAEVNRDTRLVVRSVITRDADAERFIDWDPAEREALGPEEADLHARIEESLRGELDRRLSGATLSETRCAERDGRLLVFAAVRAPTVCDARMVRLLENALRRDVEARVDLTVRSVVGADATSDGYIGRFDEWTLTNAPAERRSAVGVRAWWRSVRERFTAPEALQPPAASDSR